MPFAIEELLALIVIDCSVEAVTPSGTVLEVIPFWDAVMLLEPSAAPMAIPVGLTLTVAGLAEAQVAVFVRF